MKKQTVERLSVSFYLRIPNFAKICPERTGGLCKAESDCPVRHLPGQEPIGAGPARPFDTPEETCVDCQVKLTHFFVES